MDTNKKPWPLSTVCGIKERINTNPDFQRPAVWSQPQKQLLIDTIIRGYDIPKLYWRKTGSRPDTYDVVDGQQRLRAIWEFQAGAYALPRDADPIDGFHLASLRYTDLPDELRIQFDTYPLDVVVLSDTDEEEVREMFLRLQNGTTLKAQEKRNAMSGKMRDFIKSLAKHPFFENCRFSNSRYTFDHIAAQMTLIEIEGGPCHVKNSNLNKMYEEQKEFDENSAKARKIRRVLDYLLKAFPEKTPELERYNVISLYAMVSHLLEQYVIQDRHDDIRNWFIQFETYKDEQRKLPEDIRDPLMTSYHDKISHSTDSYESILWRHNFLLEKFFIAFPNIELKDPQRLFTYEQRRAIFRRDNGVCQVKIKCDGVKCEWDNWQADHIIPWSKGGKTVVENGQVSCVPCNLAKSGSQVV